jgi:hypothetical protein
MIGNSKGWLLAGGLGVLYLGVMVLLLLSGRRTAPTGLAGPGGAGIAGPLPGIEVGGVVPGAREGDASAAFEKIIADVGRDRELYERSVGGGRIDAATLTRLAAVDGVLGQVRYSRLTMFEAAPLRAVGYTISDDLAALVLAGGATSRVALYYHGEGRVEEARSHFRAVLVLGQRLYESRVSERQLSAGLGLMSEAAEGLALVGVEGGDRAAVEGLRAKLREVREAVSVVWPAISSIDPGVISRHNGDIPVIALTGGERVWRVEATLKLGRMKYDIGASGTPADQRFARSTLSRLLVDADPAVAVAAKLASELTVEQYRVLQ